MITSARTNDDERHGLFGRLLLIGLDGATFDVLGPLMDRGLMPELKDLVDRGVSGPLESTRPPITPAAWTTFMTGKGPGKHGIIDFLRYDPTTNRLSFNNNTKISTKAKTIWQILSDKHYRVGSINVPMTFPPEPVNGFMISGFDTPPGKDFTYPKALQKEILAKYPDYTHEKKWERKATGGEDLFRKNIEYIMQSFDRGHDLARFCGDKYGWDVMMVLYKFVDNLQHKAWRHIDERTRHENPVRAKLVEQCWTHLDSVIGKLKALAAEQNADIIVMSDHGHGSLDGKVQPNLLLKRWGYLSLRSPLAQLRIRASTLWRRLTNPGFAASIGQSSHLDQDLAIDWPRTQACVLHAGVYGFLYLNLKGRQPQGIVEPRDFNRIRAEIREKLLAAKCKDRDGKEMNIFSDVFVTEDHYNCDRAAHPWMPDLLLAPADGLAAVKKIRGNAPVRWVPFNRLEGTHRLDGVFIAQGAAVKSGITLRAHIADLAPTILAGLGEPVPKDMDGKVLRSIFTSAVDVAYEPPTERKVDEASPMLSEQQMQEVATRLSDLGYLD
ncbi:MAG: alkaline phosphatase family protein [Phycisphaerae bacterium]|nr:alkaline phosphatase family protein [Phycisphaerae bacterium]